MNYNEFIKEVDEKVAIMTEREKEKWIHNLARIIKEDERDKFLDSLNDGNSPAKIVHNIKEIQDWCEKIQNGDIADGRSGIILSQNIVTPEDDDVDAVFGTVINYIMQRGIPYQIVVRDNYIGTILVDLCEQVGIELVLSPILYGIDGFVEECYKFRF